LFASQQHFNNTETVITELDKLSWIPLVQHRLLPVDTGRTLMDTTCTAQTSVSWHWTNYHGYHLYSTDYCQLTLDKLSRIPLVQHRLVSADTGQTITDTTCTAQTSVSWHWTNSHGYHLYSTD